jgi:hypothetical protein
VQSVAPVCRRAQSRGADRYIDDDRVIASVEKSATEYTLYTVKDQSIAVTIPNQRHLISIYMAHYTTRLRRRHVKQVGFLSLEVYITFWPTHSESTNPLTGQECQPPKVQAAMPITPRKVRTQPPQRTDSANSPQAGRPPALPVFFESGCPPFPRSSVPECTTTVR